MDCWGKNSIDIPGVVALPEDLIYLNGDINHQLDTHAVLRCFMVFLWSIGQTTAQIVSIVLIFWAFQRHLLMVLLISTLGQGRMERENASDNMTAARAFDCFSENSCHPTQ